MPVVTREYKVTSIESLNEPVKVHGEGVRTKEVTIIKMATAHEEDETPDSVLEVRTLTKDNIYAVGEEGQDTVTVRIGSVDMEEIPPIITGINDDTISINTMAWQSIGGRGFVEGCTLVGVIPGADSFQDRPVKNMRVELQMERRSSNLIIFNAFSASEVSGELIVVAPNGLESNAWPLAIV